ncbi:MAG: radical SAM protein, partial [Candidatus Omnitrophota bacterium]|nr:radical SAM protein [Candidatus Omnitrophota bacterium]
TEAGSLAANGFKELILVGICLGAWGRDIFPPEIAKDVGSSGANLTDVLKALEMLDGDFRIRLSSIEPKYVTDELIEFMAGSKRLCRHLHIPLQSGDDEILKKMNRPYSTAEYRALIDKLRRAMPDIAITTDVMVGFPGERDVNFKNTLNFIKAIMPARTHIFRFSKRDGTPAYAMKPEIDKNVVRRRYYAIKIAAVMSSYIYREAFKDKVVDVLVETKRDKFTGLLTGYSANYIRVLFDGPDKLMGNIAPVRIEDINLTYTMGSSLKIS